MKRINAGCELIIVIIKTYYSYCRETTDCYRKAKVYSFTREFLTNL